MITIVALSGAIASGKSTMADAILAAASGSRLSTRKAIIERTGVKSARLPLQEAGDELDRATDFGWVADDAAMMAERQGRGIVVVDAVRRIEQVARLRDKFPGRVRHVHLAVAPGEAAGRHVARVHGVLEPETYEAVRANATEATVDDLAKGADLVIDASRLDKVSMAATALAGFKRVLTLRSLASKRLSPRCWHRIPETRNTVSRSGGAWT